MKRWKQKIRFAVIIGALLVPMTATSETKSVGEQLLALELDVIPLQVRMLDRKHTHIGLVNEMKHRPQFQMASDETKATLEDSKFNSLFLKDYESMSRLLKRERERLSVHALADLDEKEELTTYIELHERKLAPQLVELAQLIEESNAYLASRNEEIRVSEGGTDHYEAVARAENFVDTYTLGLYSYQQAYRLALAKRDEASWDEREYMAYVEALARYEEMLDSVQTFVFGE